MNKFFTMLKTELKLSFRGMDMVIFALCMPVVVAVILGVIYGTKRFMQSTRCCPCALFLEFYPYFLDAGSTDR